VGGHHQGRRHPAALNETWRRSLGAARRGTPASGLAGTKTPRRRLSRQHARHALCSGCAPQGSIAMVGYTGPNGRRYQVRNRWIALTMLGASMFGAVLGWIKLRKKRS
jgi:hypothetical protein